MMQHGTTGKSSWHDALAEHAQTALLQHMSMRVSAGLKDGQQYVEFFPQLT